MLPKQLLKSLNLTGEKDLKMAENMWKMLDEMAENRPQDYQQFVSKNVKEGLQSMQNDRKKKEEQLMVLPQPGFLLKMRATLQQRQLTDTVRNDKFNLKLQQMQPWQQIRVKFTPTIKVYLNVCHTDRVLLPLDANKNEVATFTNATIKTIVSIPHSLQQPVVKVNTEQDKVYYYTLVLNSKVFRSLMDVNPPYLMNLATSLFQERISSNLNPLLKEYNPNDYGRLAWYSIDKATIQRHKNKNYKVVKQSEPTKVLLEAGADKQQSRDVNKKQPEPKVEFKTAEKVEEVQQLKLPQLNPQKQQPLPTKSTFLSNSDLIVEVNEEEQPDTKIPFTMKSSDKECTLEFLVPGVQSISELELDISEVCVRLKITSSQRCVQIDLQHRANVDQTRAKLLKKEQKLRVSLPYC